MKTIVPISKFKSGETIQGFYLCVEKHLRNTRAGELYLDIVLRDQTGQLNAKLWDNVLEYNKKFKSGDPVAIKGNVEFFLEKLQLNIKRINKATVQNYARYGFDPALIVPTASKEPKQMWKELIQIIRAIKNPFIKKLTYSIYIKNKEKILIHPASVSMNHNYRSGLLEHVLSMSKSGLSLAQSYHLDKDLILAGVLLQDIGKLEEIDYDYESTFTIKGNLIGNISLGHDIIQKEVKNIKKFPKDLLIKIEHIILSQQVKNENKNFQKPAFKEALLINLINLMDSQLNIMDKALKEDKDLGEFTSRFNYFNTPLLKDLDGTK